MLENGWYLRVIGFDRSGEVVREFTEFYPNGVNLNDIVKDMTTIWPGVVRVVIDAAV